MNKNRNVITEAALFPISAKFGVLTEQAIGND